MNPNAIHLVPKLPPVGLHPAQETESRPRGAPFDSDEIGALRSALTESPNAPVTCPRCRGQIEHGAGEEHETTHMTTWDIRCAECGGHAVVRASLESGPRSPGFQTLVASRGQGHKVRRTAPGFATSTLVHVILIALGARYTLGSGISTTEAMTDTTMVYLTQETKADEPEPEPEPEPAQTLVVQLDQVAKGFQTVTAPVEIPTSIPPIDLGQRFDPRDYSGMGVEGGIFEGVEGGEALLSDEDVMARVFKEAVVDEPPERLSGPPLRYPRILRQAGISGHVILEFVVGTDGKAERETIEVVAASNVGFVSAARDVIVRSTFRPGRVRGRPVRVLVTQRIEFEILNRVIGN